MTARQWRDAGWYLLCVFLVGVMVGTIAFALIVGVPR